MTSLIFCVANPAVITDNIGVILKQCLLRLGQFIPIPIADRSVQIIGHIIDYQFLVDAKFLTIGIQVGILVGLDIEQLHGTMRSSRDGQWDVNGLAIGI